MTDLIDANEISQFANWYNQGRSAGKAEEHRRIMDLIREELCDEPDCASTYEHAHCQVIQAVINRIEARNA